MLLAHIFIAEHKALSNLDISISGNFDCSFVSGVLTLSRHFNNSDYYRGFHCSALIGPNGVGKSSILEVVELLTVRTDSRAFVIFYDEKENSYFVCGINMDESDVENVKTDSVHSFVIDNELFLSRNKINLVKVNNLPADDGLLMLSTRKPARYVKELTVRENVKSIKRRKQYFEKLLNYFTDGHDRDDFMEEVAFAFAFSSSPISILQVVINRKLLSDTNSVEKVGEWYRQRRTQLEFGCEVSSSLIFQSLLALNTLSILSALAADSSIEKSMILPFLLSVFADIDLQNKEGMANHNRLRHMLQRIRGADSICSFLSEESNLSNAEILKALMRMEDSLEIYLGIFDKIAESVYDNCFDGESLDLSRVTTTDYFTIDKLTGLIGKLPGNIAANMRWGWRGVSTGELARTHIFAEIFAFLKKSGCDNNIIVIDEADLYLHPEWQRTFLYDLLQHLDSVRVYENTSNPQIVICTHSPIIVSDFLPENIISLGKDEYGQTEVTKSFGFGNAIGDIYMNGMHLKSTFGEHAKKILDGIIARGRQGSLSDEDCHLIAKIPSSHVRNFLLSHD